jgi:uncharacterized membrane protein
VVIVVDSKILIVATAAFIVLFFSVTLVTADDVTVTRSISRSDINAGDSLEISVSITTNKELVTLGLQETIPLGWEIQASSSELFTYSTVGNEWIWSDFSENVPAGTATTIEYEIIVPETISSGKYQIAGTVLGRQLPDQGGDRISIPVDGDLEVSVLGVDSGDSNNLESSGSSSQNSGFSSTTNVPVPEMNENTTIASDEKTDSKADEEVKMSNIYESVESEKSNSYSESTENKIGYSNILIASFLVFCLAGLFYLHNRKL